MAVFNPTPPPTADPTYGQSSRIHQSDVVVDKTWGAAFTGLGQVIDSGVKAIDFEYKSQIDDDLYKVIDEERDAFGVADTAAMASQAGSPLDGTKEGVFREGGLPNDLIHLGPQVERLGQAHAAGKLSNRYYYARLESLVQSMRARYPGYREYVDQKVSEITGVTPANALRGAILADIEENARTGKTEQDKRLQLFKEKGHLVPQEFGRRYLSGEVSHERFLLAGHVESREKALIDIADARWNNIKNQDAFDDRTAAQNMDIRGRGLVGKFFRDLDLVIPSGFKGLNDFLVQVADGKVDLKSAEAQQSINMITQRLRIAESELRKELERPSASGYSPPSKLVNEKVAELTADFRSLETSLIDPNKGLGSITLRRYKAQAEDDKIGLIMHEKYGPLVRMQQLFNDVAGPVASGLLAQQHLGDIAAMVADTNVMAAATQPGDFVRKYGRDFSLNDAATDMRKYATNPKDPNNTEAVLKIADGLKDPRNPPKLDRNLARTVFGQGNYQFISKHFEGEDRARVYARLTSPQFVKKMTEMGGKELEDFKFWAKNEFTVMTVEQLSTAQSLIHHDQVDLKWNDTSTSWEVKAKPGLPNATVLYINNVYAPRMAELSNFMRAIKPVLALDGETPITYLYDVMRQRGIDPNTAPDSLYGIMIDIIKKGLSSEGKPKPTQEQLGGRRG